MNRGLRCQRGFSIPELMVASTLGLLVVGAVFMSYAGTLALNRHQRASSAMAEAGALALSLIRRELLMAAYVHPDMVSGDRFVPRNPLVQSRPVFGCSFGFVRASAPVGMGACGAAGTTRSDAIEINFEATLETVEPDNRNRLTDCQGAALDDPAAPGTPAGPADAATRIPTSHRYFVTISTADGTPQLSCASAQSNPQPLVPNVQELWITYGLANGWDPKVPATQRPVRYLEARDIGSSPWSDVIAVRLCVLMRSDLPVLDPQDTQTLGYIDCSGARQTASDGFLRRAYSTTVSLRNRELR